MKIAILISGAPRFCREFDTLIEQVKDHDVDWFFYLWKEYSVPDKNDMKVVADCWRNINEEWAINKIKSNLPANHSVQRLELGDLKSVSLPEVNHMAECLLDKTWPMFVSLYHVGLLKQHYELQTGTQYDLVVRARNDIEMSNPIDWNLLKQRLDQNPSYIFVADNHVYGHNGYKINDFFAVSSSRNIHIYCDAVNRLQQYNKENGILFHPETLLCHHLRQNGLIIVQENFNLGLRTLGKTNNGIYHSDFGRWA